jgi:hypothetical protein
MCVIVASIKGDRVPDSIIECMFQANPDGAGIACAVDGRVHYRRGLMKLAHVRKALAQTPKGVPFVAHFRIATVGGVQPNLCHPFPVTYLSQASLKGNIDAPVLFHNGHWRGWEDALLNSTISLGLMVPDGPLSDSRAIAILQARHGRVAELLPKDQRTVVLDQEGAMHFSGGWSKIDDPALDEVWVSNLHWRPIPLSQGKKDQKPFLVRDKRRGKHAEWERIWLGSDTAAVRKAIGGDF